MESSKVESDVMLVTPKRQRRKWSEQEKFDLLEEAASSSISGVARRHGIAPSMLFQWRKRQEGRYVGSPALHPTIADDETLDKLAQLESIEAPIIAKLVSDLRQNKLTAYNAACAYGSLVGAVTKRIATRLDTLERMKQIDEFSSSVTNRVTDDPFERECRLESERILIELVEFKKRYPEKCQPRVQQNDTSV